MGFNWGSFAGSITGDLSGGLISYSANREAAEDARHYNSIMSNSAHQREVADLKAAGLNPILSANGGASTPNAPMPSAPDMSNMGTKAINSALQTQYNKQVTDKMKEEVIANKIQNEFSKDVLMFYKSHPEFQEAVNAAMLGKQSGVGGMSGAILGAASTAQEAVKNSKAVPYVASKISSIIKAVESKKKNYNWQQDMKKLIEEIDEGKFKDYEERYKRGELQ